jgi:sugar phosphate isomerase/epimerase
MKTRLFFLRSLTLLTPFFMLFQLLHAQEIGLELYSLRNQLKTDVPGTLAKIKSWNIKEIEGGGTYGLPIDEFKKLLVQNNLKMISIAAEFDQLAKNPQTVIDEAKSFGAKYIVCFWIPHNGDQFTIDDIKKAIGVFSNAGKQIHEAGLSLCYHIHGYEFRPYEGGTLFDYFVQHTDPKYLNFEMDVFWVKHPGQDPVALLEKYPNRFLLMHLKDRKPGTEGNQNGSADEESNVVLGQGDINIAAVMKAAEEQIPKSLSYLQQLK